MIKIKNIGKETLYFTGVPAIEPGATVEISETLSHLTNHPDVEVVSNAAKAKGTEKEQSFKGVE